MYIGVVPQRIQTKNGRSSFSSSSLSAVLQGESKETLESNALTSWSIVLRLYEKWTLLLGKLGAIIRLRHNHAAVLQVSYCSASTGPAEANLHWSVLSVQVLEHKARGVWGHCFPRKIFFEFDAAS